MNGDDAVVTAIGIAPDQNSLVIGIRYFFRDFHSPMFGCNTLTINESELLHPIGLRIGEKVLLRRLLTIEHVTRFYRGSWIDGDVSFVNVPNDALFIDHEGGAIAKTLLLVEHAVVFDDGAFEIAE